MKYYNDYENNLFVIKLDKDLNDVSFKRIIDSILERRNVNNKIYCYYSFFNKDYTYCIIDFNRRKFGEKEVDEIINKKVLQLTIHHKTL